VFYLHRNGFIRCDKTGENSGEPYQVSRHQSVVTAAEVVTSENRSSATQKEVSLRSSLVVSKTSFVGGINMSLTDEPWSLQPLTAHCNNNSNIKLVVNIRDILGSFSGTDDSLILLVYDAVWIWVLVPACRWILLFSSAQYTSAVLGPACRR
jgi:hypothetical protein